MNLQRIKREICRIGKLCYDRGIVAANDGNISVRYKNTVIITPTGISKGNLRERDLVLLDLNENIIKGKRRPTSELSMHLHIYRRRSDIEAIVHTHPPFTLALSIADRFPDEAILSEQPIITGKIGIAPYATPGSDDVGKSLDEFLSDKEYGGAVLSHHGLVTWGESLEQAYFRTESTEQVSKIYLLASLLGSVRHLPI